MDERELGTLFRDAPGEPPPAGFTIRDVKLASAKVTARRRSAVAVAASFVVVVLLGGGLIGLLRNIELSETTANSAKVEGDAQAGTRGQPGLGTARPPNAQDFPTQSPQQGGEGTGEDGPRAEGTSGCDKVDRELATALAGELPVTGTTGPSPGRVCGTDSRSAGFQVTDGDRTGMISAALFPPGVAIKLATQPAGTVTAEQRTPSGGTILVLSTPDAGSAVFGAPLSGEVQRIAAALATRF